MNLLSPSLIAVGFTYALLAIVTGAWLAPTRRRLSFLKGVDGWITRTTPRDLALLVAFAFLLFVPVQAATLANPDPHEAHHELLIDHWRFFGPQADAVLRGDNPYAEPEYGDNHGLLRLWLTVLAVAVGGYTGSVYFWTATNFLLPLIARPFALRAGLSPRAANYAAFLVLLTPAALEMNAAMAQEDGLVALAILIPLFLLLRGRPVAAAVAMGFLAHVKLPTLFFTAPVFALEVAQARAWGGDLAPAVGRAVKHGLLAIAAYVPLFLVGVHFYGAPYARAILGVADPTQAPIQFTSQSFTIIDVLRHEAAARPFLLALSALTLVALVAYFLLGARRDDPAAGSLLLLLAFYLTGYYLKEHYLAWAMPLIIAWSLRGQNPTRVLIPAAASLLLHAWTAAMGGLVPEQPVRLLAAAALTGVLFYVVRANLRELRVPPPGARWTVPR